MKLLLLLVLVGCDEDADRYLFNDDAAERYIAEARKEVEERKLPEALGLTCRQFNLSTERGICRMAWCSRFEGTQLGVGGPTTLWCDIKQETKTP